jgi:hypothetical protein
MRTLSRRRAVFDAWLMLAVAATLAACSSRSPRAGSLPPTTTSISANAREDVTTVGSCSRDAAGLWVLDGAVTNRSDKRHSYTIIVDFTDIAATVEDTKTVTVPPVSPRGIATWSVSGAAGQEGIRCVIRTARTP